MKPSKMVGSRVSFIAGLASMLMLPANFACSGNDSGSVDTTERAPTSAPTATASRVATVPKRPTPTLADLGFPSTPETLTDDQRWKYVELLTFEGGDAADEAACPGRSCDPADKETKLQLQPEIGSHLLRNADFPKGWRVVAKIRLSDPSRKYSKWNLDKDSQVAYWWVGPNETGMVETMVMTRSAVVVPRHRLCIRAHDTPTTASAKWLATHGGDCVNTANFVDSLALRGRTPADSARILTFHETWFACDVGCCSAGGSRTASAN